MKEKLKALLDDRGISFKSNSKSFILTCPLCQKRDKLYIRQSDGRFVCWVCKETQGFSGKPEWCLHELFGTPVEELRRILYGGAEHSSAFIDLQLDDFFGEDDELPIFVPEDLPETMADPGFRDLQSPYGTPGKAYLENRGLPLELCVEYGIQYWPAKQSVVFPATQRGRLVGWQTRYIGPTEYVDPESGASVKVPKAMTSVGLRKEHMFMFGDRIKGDHAILCEGPIDALKAHLCGGNVASLGKAVSPYQLDLLKHSGIKRLYLALDPDAFVESGKVLREMARHVEVYDMRPPAPYSDLGEMPLAAVPQLMASARLLDPNHIFLYLKDHYDQADRWT